MYGFFLWGETESCLKGLQSRRLPSYWCRGVLPSSLLDQSLTSLLFYGWGHFTERSLTTSPQRFAKRYSSDSWGGWKRQWRAAGSFPRQEEMNLDSVTVTHTCPSTYLSSLQLWEPPVYRLVWLSQIEKALRGPQVVIEAWFQSPCRCYISVSILSFCVFIFGPYIVCGWCQTSHFSLLVAVAASYQSTNWPIHILKHFCLSCFKRKFNLPQIFYHHTPPFLKIGEIKYVI